MIKQYKIGTLATIKPNGAGNHTIYQLDISHRKEVPYSAIFVNNLQGATVKYVSDGNVSSSGLWEIVDQPGWGFYCFHDDAEVWFVDFRDLELLVPKEPLEPDPFLDIY